MVAVSVVPPGMTATKPRTKRPLIVKRASTLGIKRYRLAADPFFMRLLSEFFFMGPNTTSSPASWWDSESSGTIW